jgi:hypothetical protein
MAPPFDDGPSTAIMPPLAAPPPSTAGPQLVLSLQQNFPGLLFVDEKHWYPEGQLSSVVQGAFAPGGLAPLERQPVRAAEERNERKERKQKTRGFVTR